MSNRYAVVMGDIVGSETAPSRTTLHRRFNAATNFANNRFSKQLASPLTITLGDEFQGLTRTLADAFQIAATMRLMLLVTGVKCRFVVGTVDLETDLNKKLAWNMMGEGLAPARDKLNEKRSPNAFRFSLLGVDVLTLLLDTIGHSMSNIEEGWSMLQTEYSVDTLVNDRSVKQMAGANAITETSIYKSLRSAKMDLYREHRAAITAALSDLDSRD